MNLDVNGQQRSIDAAPQTPLLNVLRNDLGLNGAKYGCGEGQCGTCTVLVNGAAIRSCVTPIGSLGNARITTLEGLGNLERPHALQKAFITEQAAQCGYCISGMIMTASALLAKTRNPDDAAIRAALDGNLCRCGTHNRIVRAVQRAAKEMA